MSFPHLSALLRKNVILWKRSIICSLLEILIPVGLTFIFLAFRSASPLIYIPESSFVNSPVTLPPNAEYFRGALKNCRSGYSGGYIALIPEGDSIIEGMKKNFELYGYQTKYFRSDLELDDYVKNPAYSTDLPRICLGLTVNKNIQGNYEYSLRYNLTRPPSNEEIPLTTNPKTDELETQNLISFMKYYESGFLTIQNYVDNIILRQESKLPMSGIVVDLSSVSVPAQTLDNLMNLLRGNILYFILIPILLPYLRLVNTILHEKESKIREVMRIMGLDNYSFYLSWLIYYFVIFTVLSLLVSLALNITFFKKSEWIYIFLWHWTFSLSMMSLGFLITTFFTKAKVGNIFAFIIAFVLGWIKQLSESPNASESSKYWSSIAPPASAALSAFQILRFEHVQIGLNSSTISILYVNYRFYYHFIWMGIDIVIFLILGMYLDQVIPSQYGISKHPLFCIRRRAHPALYTDTPIQLTSAHEGVDPILRAQDHDGQSIVINKLRKEYGRRTAVDSISFNMYQNQIFSLLGHNGAGKTTTINMITGLVAPTSGNITFFGLDALLNIKHYRKFIGICPQHDVIFDNLTVKEHLELFGIFKGCNKTALKGEINKLIRDLDLTDKINYKAKYLSGGQKRKLSIAIAFVGGSKFILLDEPSSGMDAYSRRKLWDMLKNYKHQRVVLLTTHFMDEADYLGDRIAIMSEGKIRCLGRPLFLKSKFGIGYTLTLLKEETRVPSPPIESFIRDIIPDTKTISCASTELSIQLPLQATPRFKSLFENLDSNLKNLQIRNYGISVTTLEEVFLNVSRQTSRVDTDERTLSFSLSSSEINIIKEPQSKFQYFLAFIDQIRSLFLKRVRYSKRDLAGIFTELLVPIMMIIIGILLTKSAFLPIPEKRELSPLYWNDKDRIYYNSLLPNKKSSDNFFIDSFNPDSFEMIPLDTNQAQSLDEMMYNQRTSSNWPKYAMYLQKVDKKKGQFFYQALVDTRAQDAAPVAMNRINTAFIRYVTQNPNLSINVNIDPLPVTRGVSQVETTADGIPFGLAFSIGISFIPAGLITFIVKEKEKKIKHQQIVSGMSTTAYWIANFTFDYLKYLIPGIAAPIIAKVFGATALTEGSKYGVLWTLFITYGLSIIPFCYLTSFFFEDSSNSQTSTFYLNFGFGFIGGLTLIMLRVLPATNMLAKQLHWILRLLPTFCVSYGLLNLSNLGTYALIEGDETLKSPWDLDIAGADCLVLGASAVFYCFLVFFLEYCKKKFYFRSFRGKDQRINDLEFESDVKLEKDKIETEDNNLLSVKIDRIRKVFKLSRKKRKVAINSLSFGISNSECFTLLGVNGAGKSTLFKILSGQIAPTSGNAHIMGNDILQNKSQLKQLIGYCPQNDALLDNLTAKEHLELYASLKGIPKQRRNAIVEDLLLDLGLRHLRDIPSKAYSGGNKRKLSLALALIGNPPVILLDEPSTGMDPEARRFMWNTIARLSSERSSSSVLLTTHSMEEAEALSTRLAIMVDGELKCIGNLQHIKDKYGEGYEIEVKLTPVSTDAITNAKETLGFTEDNNQILQKNQIRTILNTLETEILEIEIDEGRSGSAIYYQLTQGKLALNTFLEWILFEKFGMELHVRYIEPL